MQTPPDLSTLYKQCGARIYGYLRRLTQSTWLAEDLTQETFLRAVENGHSFRGEGEVTNWLYRIATNLFRDYLRTRTGKTQDSWEDGEEPEVAQIPSADPPVLHLLERQEVTQCVRDCITALPALYRAVLLLYAIEGKSVEETAVILGCRKDAVKVRLHRARQLFKALVSERCEISTERGGEVNWVPKGPAKEVRS